MWWLVVCLGSDLGSYDICVCRPRVKAPWRKLLIITHSDNKVEGFFWMLASKLIRSSFFRSVFVL